MNVSNTRERDANRWVAYYRSSTKNQPYSFDIQREQVHNAAAEAGATIVAEYQEQASGLNDNRLELKRAIADTLTRRAVLVVAWHDRLTRSVAFAIDLLFTKKLPVLMLDIPPEAHTNVSIITTLFSNAQQAVLSIRDRTRAALAAKKAQGAKLGRPDAATSITAEMRANSIAARRAAADNDPANLLAAATIRQYLATATDRKQRALQAIANHLNALGVYTTTGRQHTAQSIKLLCSRYNIDRLAV